MGVMSRRVLPACGSLCYFCPSLRARSRQPVKHYKKLIADTFPRSQDGQPNERMIGKLCDYTYKNPMRIPKKMNRKLVHISVGLVFMLFWPLFSSGQLAPFFAALAPGVNIIRMLLLGLGI